MVTLQIKEFPVDLKRAIIKAAADSNMNDVAVAILARRFKVRFSKSNYVSPNPPTESPNVVLAMPRALRRAIKNAANDQDIAPRDVVIPILLRSFQSK